MVSTMQQLSAGWVEGDSSLSFYYYSSKKDTFTELVLAIIWIVQLQERNRVKSLTVSKKYCFYKFSHDIIATKKVLKVL